MANQQAFHMKTTSDLPPDFSNFQKDGLKLRLMIEGTPPSQGAPMLNLGSAALTPARLAEEPKSARMIA